MKGRLLYLFYQCLWCFIILPVAVQLLWRYRAYPSHASRIFERFSIYGFNKHLKKALTIKPRSPIWLHLASVGEVKAAMPLVIELGEKNGYSSLVVTTTTPSGAQILYDTFGDKVSHYYLPFDIQLLAKRFVRFVRPRCLLLFETEIWPGLICACDKEKVPALLINARMSERSSQRYQRFFSFSQHIFQKLVLTVAQTDQDAEYLQQLGARNIEVSGSLKSDIFISPAIKQQAAQLRQQFNDYRQPIVVAASTHKGEDELILQAYNVIKQQFPNVLLVLVPRHAERFQSVYELCQDKFIVSRHSLQEPILRETEILLGDTIGELLMLLGIADLAIMGGTFVDNGGHNFLEPVAWGVPVISGLSVYNFEEIARGLQDEQLLLKVDGYETLAKSAIDWLSSSHLLTEKKQRAQQYMDNNRGVLPRIMSAVEPYLDWYI